MINMSSIEAALKAIESLEPGKKINYIKIVKDYGVDRSTLSKFHRGVQALVKTSMKINKLSTTSNRENL
jgi:hypothetical protein